MPLPLAAFVDISDATGERGASAGGGGKATQQYRSGTTAFGGPILTMLLVVIAVMGIYFVVRDTIAAVDYDPDPALRSGPRAAVPAHLATSASAPGRASMAGRQSLVPSARPSIISSMPPTSKQQPAAGGGGGAGAAATRSSAAAAATPPRKAPVPILGLERLTMTSLGTRRGASSPAPSPRRIAGMALSRPGLEAKLLICDPSIWSHMEAFFLVQAERLPAEIGSVGDFDIIRGVSQEIAFRANVTATPPMGKRVFTLSVPGRAGHLVACTPSPGACSVVQGQIVEPCSELQIKNKEDVVWGTLSARGGDRYAVRRRGEQVLALEGDQDSGRLIVFLEGEPIAHAARSAASEHLEVGVKPNIDPILMLACVLSVVIFNPEEAVSPIASAMLVSGR